MYQMDLEGYAANSVSETNNSMSGIKILIDGHLLVYPNRNAKQTPTLHNQQKRYEHLPESHTPLTFSMGLSQTHIEHRSLHGKSRIFKKKTARLVYFLRSR